MAVSNCSYWVTTLRNSAAWINSFPTNTPPTSSPMMTSTMESSISVKPEWDGRMHRSYSRWVKKQLSWPKLPKLPKPIGRNLDAFLTVGQADQSFIAKYSRACLT